ncbi:hypothetical protein [Methanosarcina spelaei]|uniref:hypothetical protein n=1 Tax=Methanosarcina spelaei TaxID=1036679 RepID=UPI001BAEF53A|nr:hypothetical protein [Methanosarcina spelaei]
MQAEERDPEDFLIDILDSIEKIESFIEGFEFEDFSIDDKTIYAVIGHRLRKNRYQLH